MEGTKKALILAPHPDDGELGCGGTIRRMIQAGVEVHYAAFSPCVISVPDGFPSDVLYTELMDATAALGIPSANVRTYNLEVRNFPRDRQQLLEALVALNKDLKPDTVFMPCSTDVHQDHHTMYQEGRRAFKKLRMLGYELPWNTPSVRIDFHVKLEAEHIEAKIASMEAYKSQSFRGYVNADFIRSLARVRGTQVGQEFAEGFELIHWTA